MDIGDYRHDVKWVHEHLDRTEVATQLCEELAELTQAVLKWRRAISGTNPTPISAGEAHIQIIEELADVQVCLDACFPGMRDDNQAVAYRMAEKANRWKNRLLGIGDNGEVRDAWMLDEFVGKHVLSGIETGEYKGAKFVKFELDGVTYRAREDPDDGYRSYCREVETCDTPCEIKFTGQEVIGRKDPDRKKDILTLIDAVTGKDVLRIGTDYDDRYYPICIMEWTPENLACNQGRGN